LTPGRYLRDAAIASQLEPRLNNSSQLLAEAAKSSSERNVAFVWELAAQSIMYILSCAAIVFTCFFASKRMRKLNAKLENTALVEVAVAPGQLVASASSHGDDSKSSLVKTFVLVSKRDLTDVRLSSADAVVRDKVPKLAFRKFFLFREFAPHLLPCAPDSLHRPGSAPSPYIRGLAAPVFCRSSGSLRYPRFRLRCW
jgi:hypothetical protein